MWFSPIPAKTHLVAARPANTTSRSTIFDAAVREMPELIEETKEKLIRGAVQSMARGLMKGAMRENDISDKQINLFTGEMRRIQVPRCIALPTLGPEREMLWAPTFDASLHELEQHIRYLRSSAAADVARAKRLQAFYDHIVSIAGDDDPDVPIREILARRQSGAA